MPFEAACLPLKVKSYHVQELGGLLWAYLGPEPAPLLPRFEGYACEWTAPATCRRAAAAGVESLAGTSVKPQSASSVSSGRGALLLALVAASLIGPGSAPAHAQSPAGGPGGFQSIPACAEGEPVFGTLPMDLEDFIAFRPLGWLSPTAHVFPTKHSNFSLSLPGQPNAVRPVRFPVAAWVTDISSVNFDGQDKTGYSVYFSPCREFKAYFFHLSSLSDHLLGGITPGQGQCQGYSAGGSDVRNCFYRVAIRVDEGDLVGFSGDAAGVDFGATDYRVPPLGFAEPAHYSPEFLQYVSPLEYFGAGVRALLEPRVASYDGRSPRIAGPRGGELMQDVPGTAQGNWFQAGLTLAIPFQQENPFLALVHDYIDPQEPVFSIGNAWPGVRPGVYGFRPRAAGQINREFAAVTPDGATYCYDDFRTDRTTGGVPLGRLDGVILVSLPDPSTLIIEKQGGAGARCDALQPWGFTAGALRYER